MRTIELKGCKIVVIPEIRYLATIFPSGYRVHAKPTMEQDEFSEALGYTDTWDMVMLHEILHSLIAEIKGEPYSQVLFDVAHRNEIDIEAHKKEEAVVLMVQKLINRMKEINLI